jgi:hypothetical protein
MVPLQHAEKTAARLGDNAQLRVSGDTHASIWTERKEEYLRELVRAIKTEPGAAKSLLIFKVNHNLTLLDG